MEQISQSWSSDIIPPGVSASALASLGTGVGALPLLFTVVLHELIPSLQINRLTSNGSVGLVAGFLGMGVIGQVVG